MALVIINIQINNLLFKKNLITNKHCSATIKYFKNYKIKINERNL